MSMKNFIKEVKAQLGSQVLEYGVLVVVAVIIAQIVQSVQDTQTAGQGSFNVSDLGLQGLIQFGDFFVIIAVVLVGSFVIRILRTGF
ncbi:MAG: hypothetical protein CMI54_07755 [Parcubacteria group bacterium]|nr:hypothetical protein [Parcubacteria group bacterium]|tara:strand:+ start:17802 stop:18062 length:261 start_codon:yes stop_codon:yes gene_type:complete